MAVCIRCPMKCLPNFRSLLNVTEFTVDNCGYVSRFYLLILSATYQILILVAVCNQPMRCLFSLDRSRTHLVALCMASGLFHMRAVAGHRYKPTHSYIPRGKRKVAEVRWTGRLEAVLRDQFNDIHSTDSSSLLLVKAKRGRVLATKWICPEKKFLPKEVENCLQETKVVWFSLLHDSQ
jgi:hypothetical protein